MVGGLALLLAAAVAPNLLFALPPQQRLIEGVATDGESIFISSPLDRTIIVRTGTATRSIHLPELGFPLGIAWDSKRHLLWIAMDCPKIPGAPICYGGRLIAIDRKGKQKRDITFPAPMHFGDVSAERGKVFVSDSQEGTVFRVERGEWFEFVVPRGVGKSAQGTALTSNGKALIVADYSQGIVRVDLKTNKRTLLPFNGKPLRGIDGLVRRGDVFYAIQNGGSVGRLLAFRIVGDTIEVEIVAEGGALSDPTQLAVTKTGIIAVSDSGWATIDDAKFVRRKGAEILEFPIVSKP